MDGREEHKDGIVDGPPRNSTACRSARPFPDSNDGIARFALRVAGACLCVLSQDVAGDGPANTKPDGN
jgi:hypothetical protein